MSELNVVSELVLEIKKNLFQQEDLRAIRISEEVVNRGLSILLLLKNQSILGIIHFARLAQPLSLFSAALEMSCCHPCATQF